MIHLKHLYLLSGVLMGKIIFILFNRCILFYPDNKYVFHYRYISLKPVQTSICIFAETKITPF